MSRRARDGARGRDRGLSCYESMKRTLSYVQAQQFTLREFGCGQLEPNRILISCLYELLKSWCNSTGWTGSW